MPRGYIRSRGYIQSNILGGGRSGNAPKRSGGQVAEGDREAIRKYPREDVNHRSLSTPFIAGAIRYQKNKMKPTPIIWFNHRRARGSRHARPSRLTRWMRRVPSCTLAKTDCGVARYSWRRSPIGLCQNCACAASAFRRRTQQVAFLPFQVHMNLGRPAHGAAWFRFHISGDGRLRRFLVESCLCFHRTDCVNERNVSWRRVEETS